MKKISYFIVILLLLFMLFGFSYVSAEVTPDNSRLMKDNPQSFPAHGFNYIVSSDEIPPFHRLQSLIKLEFKHREEINKQFTIEYGNESIYGTSVHTLGLNLLYDKTLLKTGVNFITGTFTYYWERNGEINEYSGNLTGEIIEVSTESMGFNTDYEYTNAIALDLSVDGNPWDWTIYLEVPGEEYYYLRSTHNEEGFSSNQTNPHIPSPETQTDVAAGVAISTVGIYAINVFSGTSIFGNASFNGSFNPLSAQPSAAPSPPYTASGSSNGGFIGNAADLFKKFIVSLRDMLTDEGRSYASGKVSEHLTESAYKNTSDTTKD